MAISHLGEKIDDYLKNEAVDVKFINTVMTPLLQYLDTHANKPLKDGMKEKWEEWIAHREVDFTKIENDEGRPTIKLQSGRMMCGIALHPMPE